MIYTNKEYQRITDEYAKIKFKCSHCGHKIVIPIWVDKQICRWCNHFVFRDKQEEFKYKIKERLKR